jgi:large subunit ribosomal protein L4
MKLKIRDISGAEKGELSPTFVPVEDEKGDQAVHDVVVAYRAAQRTGTACTKTRGEVRGSKKKPWRQKGTGRARAGAVTSPIWRGGGVIFGPRPRDFSKKVNKATRRLAFRKAMGERIKANDVLVLESLSLDAPKTSQLIDILGKLNLDGGTVMLVTKGVDDNLALSARNIPYVDIATSETVNTYEILKCDKIVVTQEAFGELDERLNLK